MADRNPNKGEEKKKDTVEGGSGGNSGAGKSGKEGMGSEKPSHGQGVGSQKPGAK